MVNNINPNIIAPLQSPAVKPGEAKKTTAGSLSFNQVLEANLARQEEVKFSAHAQQRMVSRNIALSNQDLQRLKEGVAMAAAKGARESLVLKDDLAFVISIKNNTVITAVDAASMKGNIFTNIDSAIIV